MRHDKVGSLRQLTRGAGRQADRARARTAGDLMSEPPVTVHAENSIVEAARTMAGHRVERLPVLDEEDRLVGIATRRDLLQVFLRPRRGDPGPGGRRSPRAHSVLPTGRVGVQVAEGVVTLTGHLKLGGETEIAAAMTRQIDGVVDVIGELTYRPDDSRVHETQALRGVADGRQRGL
ncbi:CBS domain-containing protein [Streptomyces sp. NPDC048663]|uniref:CBS domain-containing protein n=1 Tax=Streptomyces sp. NPDC048663 TaxID=3155638 RepID=UPI0034184941